MFEIFKDKYSKDISSRIVSLFIITVFDLLIVALSLFLQKDIPNNASNILITITTACIPVAIASQTYQNIKEKELQEQKDLNGDGKIGWIINN